MATQATKTYELEIIVRKKQNKTTGNMFTTYAVKMKDGKWIETRFTQDVPKSKMPVTYSKIFVSQDMMNIDNRGKYPKLWIRGVESIKPLERPMDDLSQYFEWYVESERNSCYNALQSVKWHLVSHSAFWWRLAFRLYHARKDCKLCSR